MDALTHPTATSHAWGPATNYLHVPHQLLANLQDTPIAVGIWCLIARVSLITHAPVPLSAADLQAYDPTLTRGAILRALARLDVNHAITTHRVAGQKHQYTPLWGQTRAGIHAWQWDAPQLGRPRQLRAIRIDRTLLDTFMGQLQIHSHHAATIRRRVTAPLLSLRDVGAYALSALGYHRGTPALTHWRLVDHGSPQTIPSEATILAQLSQRMLDDPTEHLTDLGWRQLGVIQIRADTSSSNPLFFVPPSMIGGVIGPLIGEVIAQAHSSITPQTASARPKPLAAERSVTVTGSQGSQGSQGISTTPSTGGGMHAHSKNVCTNTVHQKQPVPQHARPAVLTPPLPINQHTVARDHRTASAHAATTLTVDHPVVRRLQALHINPHVMESLADLPLTTVEATIAAAQQRPDIRDVAGWVVAALRAQRDQPWHLERATPGVTDWGAVRAWARAEGLLDAEVGAAPADEAPNVYADTRPTTLASQLGRSCAQVADVAEDATYTVLTVSPDAHVWPDLPTYGQAPGAPSANGAAAHRVVKAHPAPSHVTTVELRPAWITEAHWNAMPLAIQGVFRGSQLVSGTIQARSLQTQRLITDRYGGWVRELLHAVEESG